MRKTSKNITTITLSIEDAERFKAAAEHYRFTSMASFFRACGETLCDYHDRNTTLSLPLQFK